MAKRTGYVQEFSFVSPLPSDVQSECPICLHVLREPYLVSCCGCRFCRGCVEPVGKERCPVCNSPFSCLPDKQLERLLKEKSVYCTNKSDGCEWTGPLAELEGHLNQPGFDRESCDYKNGCLFTCAECFHCKELFFRYAAKDHELTCPFKKCSYCETHRDSAGGLLKHYEQCPMYPVPCPNDCGEDRMNLAKHIDSTCSLMVIKCPYKRIGCSVEMVRGDMAKHCANDDFHLSLAMIWINNLEEKNASLRQKLEMTEATLAASSSTLPPIKYLRITNLPPSANEQMLKSIFGQHGPVEDVTMDYYSADVYYFDENSAQRALSRSLKPGGINLKSFRLSVNPVYIEEMES